MNASSRAERMEAVLRAAFAPERLHVTDDSALHAGHAGARPAGETHYSVLVVSETFREMGRVARHRAVNDALAGEFERGLHALAITARTPAEDAARAQP